MDPQAILLLVGGAFLVYSVRRYFAGRHVRKIRGPPSPSWLMGSTQQINHQLEVGDLDGQWMREYGHVWRTKGVMGKDNLVIADPKALQYMFHKSGYHFPKSAVARQFTREITGPGILFAQDKDHARIRKIMNPAFNASQLKSFLPLFRASAQKLGHKWKEILATVPQGHHERINVVAWLTRCTLDVICEVGFDVQCGALDDSLNPVMEAYKNMFADTLPYPSSLSVLFQSFWHLIPMSILKYVKYIPTKAHVRFRRTLKVINNFAKSLIDEKTEAVLAGSAEKKDIMSILVKANASEDPKYRLTDEEMMSQMATFLLAGHETTASSMTWLLYELARHPEYQQKMRAEIRAIRARVTERGDADFSVSDLDAMTYTLAAMKEVLRLHPIVYSLVRVAARDDVLPLATPVTTTDGELMSEIPIPKGTNCFVSIWAYNRLPSIWGPDAEEFKPERFIVHEKIGNTYVGVTSNLMSFSAGLQACIGWRFSIIEMQAILVELIEHFEFAIPEDRPEVVRFAAGLVTPLVKTEMHLGPQMPLNISLVH